MLNRLKLSGQARSGILRTLPEMIGLHCAMVFSIAALLMTGAYEPSAFAQAATTRRQAKSDSLVERRASLPGKSQSVGSRLGGVPLLCESQCPADGGRELGQLHPSCSAVRLSFSA
jgi:hypothetical protein